MKEVDADGDLAHTVARMGRIPIASSLFGGEILASVATATLAQSTYFDTASLLASGTVTSGYVVLGGNRNLGDGGGGTFMPGAASCGVGDERIVFPDRCGDCFYRADPTYSVREWGAPCDVARGNVDRLSCPPSPNLGLDVPGSGSALCEVGVYNAFGGLPSTLIADGGALTITTAGTIVTTGAFSAPAQLAPQTLYFLAVGCNSAVTLEGANGGSLSTTLIGAPSTTATTTQVTTTWTFSPGGLPSPFNLAGITVTNGGSPNVYAGP